MSDAGTGSTSARPVVRAVIEVHADELASLWGTRCGLVKAGGVTLREIGRFDERIAAHQDGCAIAGAAGIETLRQRLVEPDAAALFAASVVSLELQNRSFFSECLAVGETVVESAPGIASALGWISSARLGDVVKDLLRDESAERRRLGLSTCRMHGVNPGEALYTALQDADPRVRREALRTAGRLGRREVLDTVGDAAMGEGSGWAGVEATLLLGYRGEGMPRLWERARTFAATRPDIVDLVFRAAEMALVRGWLRELANDEDSLRVLIRSVGVAGDPYYVPWLVRQMEDVAVARLAGEAFCMLTGADLAGLGLEAPPPEGFQSGPSDDPDDPDVGMDPDEGLPWPDAKRIAEWWKENGGRFQDGVRYFLGAPPTPERCIGILATGHQRQRVAAAQYLCLLKPGRPLFDTSAPAWRQRRWLARLE